MSLAVFRMSAAGIFGSNTKTFGPKMVELAFEVEPAGAAPGLNAHSVTTATRTTTVDRVFQTIAEAPQVRWRSRPGCPRDRSMDANPARRVWGSRCSRGPSTRSGLARNGLPETIRFGARYCAQTPPAGEYKVTG